MENMPEEQINTQSTAILKELSEMGKVLAVIDNRLKNVENTQIETKGDIKEIKSDFVNRREFNEAMKAMREEFAPSSKELIDHETRIRAIESKVWKAIGALIVCQIIILPVLMYLFYRVIK